MLAGFETIAQGAGERDKTMPPERVAQVIVLSIVGATIFYVVIIWSASMIAPRDQLLGSDLVAARAFEIGLDSSLLMKVVLVGPLTLTVRGLLAAVQLAATPLSSTVWSVRMTLKAMASLMPIGVSG